VKVEIWSDVVCPWCYIGKRNFEAALEAFEHRDEVEVVWKAYELDPTGPAVREGAYIDRLTSKYQVPASEAQAMIDRMTTTAAGVGLDFRFDIARPGNTFDAHRVIHLAAAHGIQDQVKERLLRATFSEGEPIGDHDTLVRLAADAGLEEADVRAVLEGDAYAEDVRIDEAEAAGFVNSGVPFFVIDRTYGVSGAQPPATLANVLRQAWDETHKPALIVTGDGDAPGCEGDACAI
jgi:predicted DsbA family dithiol-disulfide isomerase